MTAALNPCPEHTKPIQSAASCGSREARAPLDGRHRRFSLSKRRRWESNPLKAALQAAALPSGSSATSFSVLARSRTSGTAAQRWSRPSPGRVRSATLREHSIKRPAEELNPVLQIRSLPCYPVHLQGKRLDQESNLDLDLRRVLCDPLHHRDVRSYQRSAVSFQHFVADR